MKRQIANLPQVNHQPKPSGLHRPARQAVHSLLRLQQALGNQAAGRFIQAKLNISQPRDVYEQEADRVAEQVMRMPAPMPALAKAGGGKMVQRKPASGDSFGASAPMTANANAFAGGGQPLADSARAFFEPRFGRDLSQVRVHASTEAAGAARALNAKAFTFGREMVFGAGEYAPETNAGRHLLAHELAHVVQQRNSPATIQRKVEVTPDAAAASQILGQFDFLCPDGGFSLSGQTIVGNCTSSSTQSCECLCDVAADTRRTYSIDVQTAAGSSRPETLHDGTVVAIPDTSVGPHTIGGNDPDIVMPAAGSDIEFGLFDSAGAAMWASDWRILAHELCGHGRLNQSYAGDKGDRPGHDVTVDTENAIAAEHGEPARGHYADPRQGESFHNPAGDRSKIVFKLVDGWHYEAP